MSHLQHRVFGAMALSVVLALHAAPVRACGGCFAPPRAVTVVTDHRMILALGSERTVLWDQIRYAGAAAEFSWILPIRYGPGVRVEVASQSFLTVADEMTRPEVAIPPCGRSNIFYTLTAQPGVVVHAEETVGPYALTIVGGSDPLAIRRWLSDNGYAIPDDIAPVIERYVELRMDFAALRLRPGVGVQQMTPVRVVVPGYNPVLPLRMIAAGTADATGISLMVFAPSQVQAQNFPNGTLEPRELSWDWAHPTDPAQDYLDAFARRNREVGGRLWLTESVQTVHAMSWRANLMALGCGEADNEDFSLAQSTCGEPCVVTRLRAALPRAALDRDLVLDACATTALPRVYNYGTVVPEAVDSATCSRVVADLSDAGATPADDTPASARCGVDASTSAPTDAAIARDGAAASDAGSDGASVADAPAREGASGSPGGCACSTRSGTSSGRVPALLSVLLGAVAARRRKNRREG